MQVLMIQKKIVNTVAAENKTREIAFITCEQNTGNIGNFIKSQNLAKNKYTAVFHDDDAIHPEYIDIAMAELTRNPNAVMATGYGAAFFNVDNNNWDILFKGHLTYPPKFGPYFNLLIGRPTFACAIYRTDAYKAVKYNYEKYGKLHDIIFMMEINLLGDIVFIQGVCMRWRQHPGSDSYTLSTGPFPREVQNIVFRIAELVKGNKFWKPLLFNFAYFLYNWSELKRFISWEDFRSTLICDDVFTSNDIKTFQNKRKIDALNKKIQKLAQATSPQYYQDYLEKRF